METKSWMVMALTVLGCVNAHAMDNRQYENREYDHRQYVQEPYGENFSIRKPEAEIQRWDGIVDRHVFKDPEDYLLDPQVLISGVPTRKVLGTQVSFQRLEGTLDKLVKQLKNVQYDPAARTIKNSRSPQEVLAQGKGNCFEVARLAAMYLQREGYNAHIVDIKTKNGKNWHSICAFEELNGTWSIISADKTRIGYTSSRAKNLQELVDLQFNDVAEMKVII